MGEKNLDKQGLADKLKISYQGVRKVLELGGAFGSKNNLKAAELFGVNPVWLATGTGEKFMDTNNPPTESANDLDEFSPHAHSLAREFDTLPKDDWSGLMRVYHDAFAVMIAYKDQRQGRLPTPAHQSSPDTPASAPLPLKDLDK
jgi:hypothetical protein